MFESKHLPAQQLLWIPAQEVVQTSANSFYARLDAALEAMDLPKQVRALCRPFYDQHGRGRPGVDPVVYFKMLIIGFFENLSSERAIAARCQDSLAIRSFLHYDLTTATPDHSTLTLIRQRLAPEVYEQVFALVLRALKQHGLLRGTKLGIDASTLEANASMRSLEKRLSGESYAEYVRKLAAEAGVDREDDAAVRRFDRKREDKKVSNDEWHNPNDADAKIGKTKQGTTKLIYKVEHTADLETGAIVDVDVLPGHQADTADLCRRVQGIQERMNAALGKQPDEQPDEQPGEQTTLSITTDKGYYDTDELRRLQELGIETVVPDRITNRNLGRLSEAQRTAVLAARRAVEDGRALMKRRAEYVERSFAHMLESGGARRTTLHGQHNIRKRYLIQAMSCNLSLLMRSLTGIGTVKQALAAGLDALERGLIYVLKALREAPLRPVAIRSFPQACIWQKAASPTCLRLAA